MQCDLTFGSPQSASDDGMVATTMRIVKRNPRRLRGGARADLLSRVAAHAPEGAVRRLAGGVVADLGMTFHEELGMRLLPRADGERWYRNPGATSSGQTA